MARTKNEENRKRKAEVNPAGKSGEEPKKNEKSKDKGKDEEKSKNKKAHSPAEASEGSVNRRGSITDAPAPKRPRQHMRFLPNSTIIQQEFSVTKSEKMDLVAKLVDGRITFCAKPAEFHFSLGGANWRIVFVMNEGGRMNVTTRIENPMYSKHWTVSTSLSFVFSRISADGTQKKVDIPNSETATFSPNRRECSNMVHFAPVVPFEPILKAPEKNEKSGTTLEVELEFTMADIVGFRSRNAFLYDFTMPCQKSDLVLRFGSESVFVDSGFLAYHSKIFFAMTYRSPRQQDENGLPIREISGVKKQEFIELLNIVYPSRKQITDENVVFIMALADRFEFEQVLQDCEKFLLTEESEGDIFEKLHWASTYKLSDLQDWCLAQLTTRDSIDKVRESDVYSKLSAEVKSCLLDRLLGV